MAVPAPLLAYRKSSRSDRSVGNFHSCITAHNAGHLPDQSFPVRNIAHGAGEGAVIISTSGPNQIHDGGLPTGVWLEDSLLT